MRQTGLEPSFAQFLYGIADDVKQAVASEGGRWAQQYAQSASFPAVQSAAIAPGTVVWTDNTSDLRPELPQWRVYFTRALAAAINAALGWRNHVQVNADFERFTLQFAWGALDAAVGHVFPNSIPTVSQRIGAVLASWETLDSLRYVDRQLQPVVLGDLMQDHYGSLLDMWLDGSSGDIRADLQRATELMRNPGADAIREKVVARLSRLAREEGRLRNPARLGDPAWLRQEIAALEPPAYDNMTTGYLPALRRNLIIWDESIDAKRGE